MPSIFNTLHIGYSGLTAAQVGIDTTGHNITNTESDGYTRQRVVTSAATPISNRVGAVGNGTDITAITRVFDNFVFDRFTAVSAEKEYSDYEKKTLEELSTYFPEIDAVGIKADLEEYYNMWQTFADNPDNDAIRLALARQTETLSKHIGQTQNQILTLQNQVNEELVVSINEVNSIAEELTEVNKAIAVAEAGGALTANDLRDKRNVLERDLSKLIGAETFSQSLESNTEINISSNTKTGNYSVSINGFNLVDNSSYHPIHISNENNANGFYEISFERQDGQLISMEDTLKYGKVGAILDLRGGTIDSTSGAPTDGIIQNAASQLDSFAKGLIEATNNLYSKTPATRMDSNILNVTPTNALLNTPLNVKEGFFDVAVYDIDGNKVASRKIEINVATTMTGVQGSNSIEGQLAAQVDDNSDSNANNDIDDFIQFNWATYPSGDSALELAMDSRFESQGYTFSIIDELPDSTFSSGTNFAGALGLNRFFDGDSASDINLNSSLRDNPTLISAGYTSASGDNRLALDMIQQQYEEYVFNVSGLEYKTTTYGMFDIIATEVGSATNAAIFRNETIVTKFNATELEYSSISKVSIDEEMTNLIKYQTSFAAAAKVITTVDQMMQTLLGMKQ